MSRGANLKKLCSYCIFIRYLMSVNFRPLRFSQDGNSELIDNLGAPKLLVSIDANNTPQNNKDI